MSAPSRPRRIALRLGLALLVGVVFFEGGLRILLTSPWTRDSGAARAVGDPARFAFPHEDLYWRFVHRLETGEAPRYLAPHDARLGWVWTGIEPGTYAHDEASLVAGRRPVFLFGDSYSACLTERRECFQGLMEHSVLGDRCQLLNYGVCGYGFDQTALLTRAVVERFGAADPVVVVGILVDDDLTRMLLELREYPKPRLRLADGHLVVPTEAVGSLEAYRADPAPLPASWAWAWLRQAFREQPMLDPDSPERREVVDLTRVILGELVADLRARELDHFFVLFYTAHSFPENEPLDWRTRLVRETLDGLGARWYDVRDGLARALEERGGELAQFYIPYGERGGGHYNAAGNAVALDVMLRGLEEVAGFETTVDGRPRVWAFERALGDGGGTATYMAAARPPFQSTDDGPCVVLRAPGTTPTAITWALEQGARRFTAELWAFQPDDEQHPFTLRAHVDGRQVWEGIARAGEEPLAVEVALDGARALELSLAPHVRRGAAVLSAPRLE